MSLFNIKGNLDVFAVSFTIRITKKSRNSDKNHLIRDETIKTKKRRNSYHSGVFINNCKKYTCNIIVLGL